MQHAYTHAHIHKTSLLAARIHTRTHRNQPVRSVAHTHAHAGYAVKNGFWLLSFVTVFATLSLYVLIFLNYFERKIIANIRHTRTQPYVYTHAHTTTQCTRPNSDCARSLVLTATVLWTNSYTSSQRRHTLLRVAASGELIFEHVAHPDT